MILTKKQAEFMKKEFGFDFCADVEIDIPRQVKIEIHDRAFDIEADELPANNDEEWSERCKLAVEICDLMYDALKGSKD